jgi:RimJ/RimL family protein N-acetyltransferase
MTRGAGDRNVNPDGLGLDLPVLGGDGLVLRPLTRTDVDAVFELFGDPAVVRHMSIALLGSTDDARAFIDDVRRHFVAGSLYQWGIEIDGELAGTCTLAGISREHGRAEVGFAVLRRLRGRRILSRALPRLVEFAFERLQLNRLESDVDPENGPSLRALERLGFRREGRLRERYRYDDEARDAVLLGLLRREWPRS